MAAHCLVTGGAGFIGSNLVDALLRDGCSVVAYDNFSTGFYEFLEGALQSPNFRLVRGDLLDIETLTAAMEGVDQVFHLAANADVRFGGDHPDRDLQQNTIGTFNVLEAMRRQGVRRIAFSSTGSIYGEPTVFPTPEDAPFPIQTSLYGASKLAGEGLISAYSETFGFQATIFRFVSVLGERYTHGHVFDFVAKLRQDPSRLPILGDGRQRKSYMHVGDCIAGMRLAVAAQSEQLCIYNLGFDGYVEVRQSAEWIGARLGLQPSFDFAGGARGWIGDSPFIFLDTRRIQAIGWRPAVPIKDAVERTVDWLVENAWVYERRN